MPSPAPDKPAALPACPCHPAPEPARPGRHRLAEACRQAARKALRATWHLLKIALPVGLAVRILDLFGWLEPMNGALSPCMRWLDLPAEAGIVWFSSMATSIYGGLAAFGTLAAKMDLDVGQATVLATAILFAHSLPVEAGVAREAGVRLPFTLAWRIGGGLLAGWLLALCYRLVPWPGLHEKIVLDTAALARDGLSDRIWQKIAPAAWHDAHSWPCWIWDRAVVFTLQIFLVIFALMLLMEGLEAAGLLNLVRRALRWMLRWVGISAAAAPVTLIGMILGITYGGGLIIEETKEGALHEHDVFLSLALLGLSHGIIEDSLLMWQFMGAHWSGTLLWRIAFTMLAMLALVRLTLWLPHRLFRRLAMAEPKRETGRTARP